MSSNPQNPLRIGERLLSGLRQFRRPRDRRQTTCSPWVRSRLFALGLIEIDTKSLGVGTGWRFKLTKRGREILRANQAANIEEPKPDELEWT